MRPAVQSKLPDDDGGGGGESLQQTATWTLSVWPVPSLCHQTAVIAN